jgi:uncharacterized phage protein (TIGR02220 family)
MADNGRWFKLWCSCASDPSLDNLPIADFGRWAKLGAIIKEQGTDGVLIISEPARLLCAALQVASFSELISCIQTFPNVTVTSVTNANVTSKIEYYNWWKYQGDFSGDRVKRHRAKMRESVTAKKRGEEKRREEKRKEQEPSVGQAPPRDKNGFREKAESVLTWLNGKSRRNYRPSPTNLDMIVNRLKDGIADWQLRAIITRKCREWDTDEMRKYLRPATLFNKTKCEQYLGELPREDGYGLS